MKSSFFLWRHGEADARFEGVGLVAELGVGENEPRLDAQHVERLEAQRREPVRPPASHTASNTARASFGWQKIS